MGRIQTKRPSAAVAVMASLLTAAAGLFALPASVAAVSLTFTVNKTGDASDLHPGDGKCDSSTNAGLQCTLRAAIQEANAHAGADTINFNITTTSKTITPASPLPAITGTVTIDGYSQTGASANTKANSDNAVLKIVLSGANAGSTANGLDIESSGSVLRGLVIRDFGNEGVLIGGNGNTVRGDFIGTNAAGTVAGPNFLGVEVEGSNNVIGGTVAAARNVVSGNTTGIDIFGPGATGNQVQGNFIGTDKTGKVAVPNSSGVEVGDAPSNTIGGTAAGARNIVSGNTGFGVSITGTTGNNNSVVEGNYIGTDVTGTAPLGNGISGILLKANAVTIGGTTAAARNVISASVAHGIELFAGSGPAPNGNVIQGNYVGLNAAGTAALGNQADGMSIFGGTNTLIGGSVAGAGNVVSGNLLDGISLFTDTSATTVQGNKIGTKFDGTGLIGNGGAGISVSGSNNNTIGGSGLASNLISHNNLDAISLDHATGNLITGNSIIQNGGQGVDASSGPNTISGNSFVADDEGVRVETTATGIRIVGNTMTNDGGFGINLMGGTVDAHGVVVNDPGDTDTGANNLQNFPVLSTATRAFTGLTTIKGSLNSHANTTYRIEVFIADGDPSGHGEGSTFLGFKNVTTGSGGNASFSIVVAGVAFGQLITATAISPSGDTSEFAANIPVPVP